MRKFFGRYGCGGKQRVARASPLRWVIVHQLDVSCDCGWVNTRQGSVLGFDNSFARQVKHFAMISTVTTLSPRFRAAPAARNRGVPMVDRPIWIKAYFF